MRRGGSAARSLDGGPPGNGELEHVEIDARQLGEHFVFASVRWKAPDTDTSPLQRLACLVPAIRR